MEELLIVYAAVWAASVKSDALACYMHGVRYRPLLSMVSCALWPATFFIVVFGMGVHTRRWPAASVLRDRQIITTPTDETK